MSDPTPTTLPAIVAAYRCQPAAALIYDESTELLSEELAGFLIGGLGLAPEAYPPAALLTLAAIMVERLGLRDGGRRWYTRIVARIVGLGQ